MKRILIPFLAIIIVLIGLSVETLAQEQGEDVENLRLMDTGVTHMENGEYATADQYFRIVIDNMQVLPTEICYYFGKNSFHLKKYKQSIDWLNKYIELKGVKGEFFDDAVALLKKSEQAYNAQQTHTPPSEQESVVAGKQSIIANIDCSEGQAVVCPVCNGTGVVRKPGLLGEEVYSSCTYGENGAMDCEDYKLYVQGKLGKKTSTP